MENELLNIESLSAIDLYVETNNLLETILERLNEEAERFVPDTTTISGRKEIASFSRQFSSTKVLLDNLGKGLVEDRKKQLKNIDEKRKQIRDECDRLRDYVRQPLTDYEKEEVDLIKAELLREEIEQAEIDAYEMDAIITKQHENQAELDRLRSENEERERKEREAHEAKDREARRQREIKEAEERARQHERERIESQQREKEAKEKAEKEAEERRQNNANHQKRIEREIFESLLMINMPDDLAAELIKETRLGHINHLKIEY